MAERGRILLIKPVLPYPPNQGTKVLSFGLIRALQQEFDVTVLARILSPGEIAAATELEKFCDRVVIVMAPNRKSLLHRLAYKLYFSTVALVRRRSLKSLYDCPPPLVRAAQVLAREHFDLVIIEYWQLQRLLDIFPADRTVLLTHDIDMLVNRQVSLLERNLVRKIQAVRRWLLEQKEEIRAYRRTRNVWALTERDKHAVELLTRNNARVDVLPFAFDVDFNQPSGMRRNAGEVLFMGYLGAAFNRDAIEFFVRKVYPHLDDIEGLSITVVGGELPKELEFFGLQPDVEVVGLVPDVRPYLHRASCLIVPMRYGGGLRIRILEAMSAGLPVVSTPDGIAGMPFEAGRHYAEGKDGAGLAAAVARVIAEPTEAARMAEEARKRVHEVYGAEQAATATRTLARRLIEAR